MWFAWLLRFDLRRLAAPNNSAVQRDFVVWWLLHGRAQYPAVWHWDQEQAKIAMELVRVGHDLLCPRLLRRAHEWRDDLQKAFPLRNSEGLAGLLCWYRLRGPLELDAAPPLPKSSISITEQPCGNAGIPLVAIALANCLPNRSLLTAAEPHVIAEWYREYGRNLLPSPPTRQAPVVVHNHAIRNHGGVNLVGFVRGQSGLGEDVRMGSAALEAVSIPHVLFDAPIASAIPQGDDSLAHRLVNQLTYDITVYCMSAFDTATLYLTCGPGFFGGQYRIGYWPWELANFPNLWREAYGLVDEIWTGSAFTTNAYRRSSRIPVHTLPTPVIVPPLKPMPRHRLRLLNEQAFVFLYQFDVNSYLARKNPISLVRGFHRAFRPNDKSVALLLRVNGDPSSHPRWQEVAREVSSDPRITVLVGTLDRKEALRIVAASDCLVSPHRAEGFGRNIAEAILLGLPVLATAYSGCMDFLQPSEGIPFVFTPVKAGDYPFGERQRWAEPAVDELANKMRIIRRAGELDPSGERQRLLRRRSELASMYSPVNTGRNFARRLSQIKEILRTRSASQRYSQVS
jgi:glycosyltransferase involved in cell wall biosynthesis